MTDPISSRIDSYQADLARLEAEFVAAREALHTEFKADIAALVHNGNWQVYPERHEWDAMVTLPQVKITPPMNEIPGIYVGQRRTRGYAE